MGMELYNIHVGYNHTYLGMLVCNEETAVDDMDHVNDVIAMKMGFDRMADYLNSLPGNPIDLSDINCFYDSMKNATYALEWEIDDNHLCYSFLIKYIKCIHEVSINDQPINSRLDGTRCMFRDGFIDTNHMVFIIRPTKDSMMKVDGFENCKNEDLWFCEDWKEVN